MAWWSFTFSVEPPALETMVVKARLLAFLAPVPAAITYGMSVLPAGPRFDYKWAHFAVLFGFGYALLGVPAAVLFVALHTLKPTPRRAWLCVLGAIVNLVAVALFLLAAAIAATSFVDTTTVFALFSLFPAAAAAALLWRTRSRADEVRTDAQLDSRNPR